MKNFRHNFSAILVLVTVCLVNGWHLPLLQGVAWINMFQEYNEVMPASKALAFTVSGEELCELCKFVKTESNDTQKHWNQWNDSRTQLVVSSQNLGNVPVSESLNTGITEYTFNLIEYSSSPQAPPPKLLLA